jgi:hypothetical protein
VRGIAATSPDQRDEGVMKAPDATYEQDRQRKMNIATYRQTQRFFARSGKIDVREAA